MVASNNEFYRIYRREMTLEMPLHRHECKMFFSGAILARHFGPPFWRVFEILEIQKNNSNV